MPDHLSTGIDLGGAVIEGIVGQLYGARSIVEIDLEVAAVIAVPNHLGAVVELGVIVVGGVIGQLDDVCSVIEEDLVVGPLGGVPHKLSAGVDLGDAVPIIVLRDLSRFLPVVEIDLVIGSIGAGPDDLTGVIDLRRTVIVGIMRQRLDAVPGLGKGRPGNHDHDRHQKQKRDSVESCHFFLSVLLHQLNRPVSLHVQSAAAKDLPDLPTPLGRAVWLDPSTRLGAGDSVQPPRRMGRACLPTHDLPVILLVLRPRNEAEPQPSLTNGDGPTQLSI